MRIIHLALVLALVVLAAPAWGADLDRWFHVSWGPAPHSNTPKPRIQASVRNDSPYRVTDVQLEVEGLTPDERGRSGTSSRVVSRHSSPRRWMEPSRIGSR